MAASVVFLGWFSMKERRQIRAEMADYLGKTTAGAVKCSPKWIEKGGAMNSKLVKQILKEYGSNGAHTSQLIHPSHGSVGGGSILSSETLSESLFTLMFAPSCPYLSDPTGQMLRYLQGAMESQTT